MKLEEPEVPNKDPSKFQTTLQARSTAVPVTQPVVESTEASTVPEQKLCPVVREVMHPQNHRYLLRLAPVVDPLEGHLSFRRQVPSAHQYHHDQAKIKH